MSRVIVPLVLNVASGLADEDINLSISLWICKVHVATKLKMTFAGAMKAYLLEHLNAPIRTTIYYW